MVYVKEGDQIADLLGMMEARKSLLKLENVRILREMRGSVNRKVNCETANINKTVNAAVKQIEDIRYIRDTAGFSGLSNGLDEMARIRLQYPEATLKELGMMLDPPVGKSGVNHRLRKLSAIADALRSKEEKIIMIKKPITIQISNGLEARPYRHAGTGGKASLKVKIYVESGNKKVNAKSIMGMMTLGLDAGDSVTISVNGADESEAMNQIEGYLTSRG